jgi:hypothetical protein
MKSPLADAKANKKKTVFLAQEDYLQLTKISFSYGTAHVK